NYGSNMMAHSAQTAWGGGYAGSSLEGAYRMHPSLNYRGKTPLSFYGMSFAQIQSTYGWHGDFDNGAGEMIDGPYINKPDEGNTHRLGSRQSSSINLFWQTEAQLGSIPYFSQPWAQEAGGPAYFSPNRLISGPGMFGSMPSGSVTNRPWQTLLFRPKVEGSSLYASRHPGEEDQPTAGMPPDHMLLELFWMPVVEPYAISEPMSTAGKINPNFGMHPFRHVKRASSMLGVFRSEYMLCVPNTWSRDYKHNHGQGRGYHWRDAPTGGQLYRRRLRSTIQESGTINQFVDKFDSGEVFKTSSAITEIHLIPEDVSVRLGGAGGYDIGTYTPTVGQMSNGKYWEDHRLVGDNSREKPYTNIQARMTAKSNTFKVHYRGQVITQATVSDRDYNFFDPEMDSATGEYRGSSIVERYMDPNDGRIPDYTGELSNVAEVSFTVGGKEVVGEFYRYRILNPTRFSP
ncbi:MAG: Verru_Chthon cassette protein A, partial [Verrucomicrobiota bacterium]